jgi:diguanylate cyclase (GGDEF)-like protein
MPATGQPPEIGSLGQSAASDVPEALLAREAAVLAREQAVDQREIAAERRDKAAAEREENMRAAAKDRAHGDSKLLEANGNLVAAAIRSQTLTEAAELSAVQMALRADRDFLTKLPNRAVLYDRLAQSIALAKRHGKRVALMYLDLDNFKNVNDLLGHSAGDQLLQSVATRLKGCIRQSDTVSRQGGDEFVVLLSEIEAAQDATLAAAKLVKAMAEPHAIGVHRLTVTMSLGIAVYPDDGTDAEAILTNADTAMYQVKRHGRNGYRRFAPEIDAMREVESGTGQKVTQGREIARRN